MHIVNTFYFIIIVIILPIRALVWKLRSPGSSCIVPMFVQQLNNVTGARNVVDLPPDCYYVDRDTRSSCVYRQTVPPFSCLWCCQCLIIVIYRPSIIKCQRQRRGARCYRCWSTAAYKPDCSTTLHGRVPLITNGSATLLWTIFGPHSALRAFTSAFSMIYVHIALATQRQLSFLLSSLQLKCWKVYVWLYNLYWIA